MKKKSKKVIKRKSAPGNKKATRIFTMGNVQSSRKSKLLLVILAIVFFETSSLLPKYFPKNDTRAQVQDLSALHQPVRNANLQREINKMVKGYPIEEMVPFIASKDRQTAAFLVAIAKKESAWGKRKPVLEGENCFNYWGFRLKSDRMGSGGHTCFDNPKQAVDTVAARIEELVKEYDRDTASKMIVWKCGTSCDGHSDESVKKWISDVDYYYKQVLN